MVEEQETRFYSRFKEAIRIRFHNILYDDMRNGDGLRITVFVSGCEHHCKGCQNPVTWDPNDGIKFMMVDYMDIIEALRDGDEYLSGVTFTGGDPLHLENRETIDILCTWLKYAFPHKTIWIYTGYTWEEVKDLPLMKYVDVLVDGKFVEELKDVKYKWAGSTNQRVIDVQRSLESGTVVLHT